MQATDLRIHQNPPGLEIAFDSGEIIHLPWQIQSLTPLDHNAIKIVFTDQTEKTFTWDQLYPQTKR